MRTATTLIAAIFLLTAPASGCGKSDDEKASDDDTASNDDRAGTAKGAPSAGGGDTATDRGSPASREDKMSKDEAMAALEAEENRRDVAMAENDAAQLRAEMQELAALVSAAQAELEAAITTGDDEAQQMAKAKLEHLREKRSTMKKRAAASSATSAANAPLGGSPSTEVTAEMAETIESWVAMWEQVAKVGLELGGDCEETAAAWTKLFKANQPTFRAIGKMGEELGEDGVTALFGDRVKEPMETFMKVTNKCGQSAAMMQTLQTMNRMYM